MRILFLLLIIGLPLSGCGIKPGGVEPPAGSENHSYPATYPNPNTDP